MQPGYDPLLSSNEVKIRCCCFTIVRCLRFFGGVVYLHFKEPCCAAAMTDISVFQVLLSHTEYILGPVYPYTHNFCAIYRRVGCSRRVCDVRCPVKEFLLTFFLSCLNTLLNSLPRGLGSLLCFQDVNKKKSFLGNGKKNDCPSVLLHQLQLENCYFHNNSTHSRS